MVVPAPPIVLIAEVGRRLVQTMKRALSTFWEKALVGDAPTSSNTSAGRHDLR